MQLDSNLTLESAVTMVKNKELEHAQQDSIRKEIKKEFSVETISTNKFVRQKFDKNNSRDSFATRDWKCYFCGGSTQHSRDNCRARKVNCNTCNKI